MRLLYLAEMRVLFEIGDGHGGVSIAVCGT
jgi:hypothetical protein